MRRRLSTLAMGGVLLALAAGTTGAQNGHDLYQQALRKERAAGDLPGAIALYRQVVATGDRTLAAQALLRIGESYEKLGRAEAREAYQWLLREFADQAEPARAARVRLAALERPAPPGAPTATAAAAGPPRLTTRLVWEGTEPTIDVGGQPTPDGKHLTFVDWMTGDLALRDLEQGTQRRLTKVGYPHFALQSSVSRDGRRVAYHWRFEEEGQQSQLRVIGVDGTDERTLLDGAAREIVYLSPHEWTPDGREVLVLLYLRDGTGQIAFASVADATLRVVRSFDWRRPFLISLSPDGRHIVYDRPVDEASLQRDIYLLAADGSREIPLVTHAANDQHPVWTPDGEHVVFSSDRGGSIDLWAIQVRAGEPTGEPVLVKRDMAHNFFWPMGFTSDGALFYAKDTGGGDVYVASLDPATGKSGGPPRRVVDTQIGYNTAPHISPAGDRIVFVTRTGAITLGHAARVAVQPLSGTARPELIPSLTVNRKRGRPRWAADGRHFVVVGIRGRTSGVFRVDAETGAVESIASAPRSEVQYHRAQFVEGGSAVVYASTELSNDASGDFVLRRKDLGSGEETELYRKPSGPGGWNRTWDVTENGRLLAIADRYGDQRQIRVVDLASGSERTLHQLPSEHAAPSSVGLAWTPDGRYVLFGLAPGDWELTHGEGVAVWRMPVDGVASEPIGLEIPHLRHLSVLADGSGVAFAAGHEVYHEVWVLENALAQLSGRR